ncbi:MAG: hypothetical protein HRF50_15095 [Phycisphaerae bacterium]
MGDVKARTLARDERCRPGDYAGGLIRTGEARKRELAGEANGAGACYFGEAGRGYEGSGMVQAAAQFEQALLLSNIMARLRKRSYPYLIGVLHGLQLEDSKAEEEARRAAGSGARAKSR